MFVRKEACAITPHDLARLNRTELTFLARAVCQKAVFKAEPRASIEEFLSVGLRALRTPVELPLLQTSIVGRVLVRYDPVIERYDLFAKVVHQDDAKNLVHARQLRVRRAGIESGGEFLPLEEMHGETFALRSSLIRDATSALVRSKTVNATDPTYHAWDGAARGIEVATYPADARPRPSRPHPLEMVEFVDLIAPHVPSARGALGLMRRPSGSPPPPSSAVPATAEEEAARALLSLI